MATYVFQRKAFVDGRERLPGETLPDHIDLDRADRLHRNGIVVRVPDASTDNPEGVISVDQYRQEQGAKIDALRAKIEEAVEFQSQAGADLERAEAEVIAAQTRASSAEGEIAAMREQLALAERALTAPASIPAPMRRNAAGLPELDQSPASTAQMERARARQAETGESTVLDAALAEGAGEHKTFLDESVTDPTFTNPPLANSTDVEIGPRSTAAADAAADQQNGGRRGPGRPRKNGN